MLEKLLSVFDEFPQALILDVFKNIAFALGGLVLSGITALIWILYNHKKKSFFRSLYKALYGIKDVKSDKENFREAYAKFRKYVPHRLKEADSGKELSFKELYKELNGDGHNKCIFILGSSGVGKTTVLQQLAYRLKKNKTKARAKSLVDYGIIYRQFKSQQFDRTDDSADGIKALFEYVKSDIDAVKSEDAVIILDGLDEAFDFLKLSSEEVLSELAGEISKLLSRTNQSDKIRKIIISLRPEVFPEGVRIINDINLPKTVYEVRLFNKEQAVAMYKSTSYRRRERAAVRRENLKRLTKLFDGKGTKDCVFAYPFILEWASELFAEIPDDSLLTQNNLYSILDTITNRALIREYEILGNVYSRSSQFRENTAFSTEEGRAFTRMLAEKMLRNNAVNNCFISPDRLKQSSSDSTELLLKSTRRLLRLTDSSAEDAQYTFLHNMFYWYFVADILTDENADISLSDRKRYVSAFRQTPVPSLYVQALFAKYPKNLERSGIMPQTPREFSHVRFNSTSENGIYLDRLLGFFPSIEQLTLNGVYFGKDATENILMSRELDLLNSKSEESLKCLLCFSPDFIRMLDISSSKFNNAKVAAEYVSRLTSLEELDISEAVMNIKSFFRSLGLSCAPRLIVSCKTGEDIGFLWEDVPLPFSEICVKILSKNPFNPIYLSLYEKRKQGLNISLWDTTFLYETEDCTDESIAEAVYELNKPVIKRFFENQNINISKRLESFVHLALIYMRLLKKRGDEGKISEVFDFVIGFISDSSEAKWSITPKNLYDTDGKKELLFEFIKIAAECDSVINTKARFFLGDFFYYTNLNKRDYFKAFYWYKSAAENGSAAGMYSLGFCYHHAYGTEENPEEAYSWYKKAAENGNASGMYNLGWCYHHAYGTEENPKEAYKWYKKAAENGDASGMCNLGWCYHHAYGTKENPGEAYKWYKKSAENGNASGMYNLGWCYHYAYGTEESPEEAYEWYKKSAENGSAGGMNQLGWCYHHAYGTEENPGEAYEWYKKSAENGNATGMDWLGWCYQNKIGTEENPEEAYKWYKKAAENGDASGMCDLGWCYQNACGTEENPEEAYNWYKKSAENGNASGMRNLGWCYQNAYGTEENPGEAFKWYKKSAENGNASGMRNLGRCYHKAYGTEENPGEAYKWYKKSAENGDAAGMDWLGWCYQHKIGTEENPEEAYKWYKKSAENGNASGMCNLGWCYHHAYGTEENPGEAYKWFKKSAENGDSSGMCNLGWCYHYAYGTEENPEEAYKWYKKSAKNGDASGMNQLGWCYHYAYGTEENPEEAYKWYKRAAENGSAGGMNQLGWCYHHAYGTEENPEEAYKWYKKSAENGNTSGMAWLAVCYREGYGTEKDERQAAYWEAKSKE